MKRGQLRSIEGARGLAAFSVLVYHAFWFSPGAAAHSNPVASRLWLGVPLFFLLSGFLLFRPFARAIVRGTRWPSMTRYAKARFLRIVPAYWVALSVSIALEMRYMRPSVLEAAAVGAWVWCWATHRRPYPAIVLTAVALPLALSARPELTWAGFTNFFLVWIPFGPYTLMGVSWTLCIELSFYLLLPLLSLGLAQMARRWSSAAARAAVAALPLLCALPLSWAFVAQVGTAQPMHLWLPAFIDEFAIGMLLAIALEFRPHVSLTQSRVLLAVAVLVAVTANVYCFDVGPLAPYGNGSSMLFGRLMTVAFALALGSVLARQEGTVLGRFRSSRTLTLAGTISYGIYLWHPFVIDELRRTPLWQNAWGNVPMVMVGAIVCATASWLLVERPALRLKDRQWRPEAPPATEHPIAAVEAVNT